MADERTTEPRGNCLENSSGIIDSSQSGHLLEGLSRDGEGQEYCAHCGSYEIARCGEIYKCYECGDGRGD